MPACKKCAVDKSVNDFYASDPKTCKRCRNAAHVIYQRERYKADPEFKARSLANVKRWERRNPKNAADANRIRSNRTLHRMRRALTDKYAVHSVASWLRISRASVTQEQAKIQKVRLQIYRELHRSKA